MSAAAHPLEITVHRFALGSGREATAAWAAWTRAWPRHGLRQVVWRDKDVRPLLRTAFPDLAPAILAMRALIERVDMARLAIMYLHGGVYADLDMELLHFEWLRCVVRLGRIVLPFEADRLVGQSLLISPPREPFWPALASELVRAYNSSCYETANTGPDAITSVWNAWGCAPRHTRRVLLMRGFIDGRRPAPRLRHVANRRQPRAAGGRLRLPVP